MKSKSPILTLFLLLAAATSGVAEFNTVFTYQGRLTDGDRPATGAYDLQFNFGTPPRSAIKSVAT